MCGSGDAGQTVMIPMHHHLLPTDRLKLTIQCNLYINSIALYHIQTHVDDPKDPVIIRITGVVVDWLVKAAPKVYEPYVFINKRGEKSLLVECHNAIYG